MKNCFSFISTCHYKKTPKKVGSKFSFFVNIIFVAPQGYILGIMLCVIFISDLFLINNNIDFVIYGGDTSPYFWGQNFSVVINLLESNVTNVFPWFHKNGLTANSSKNHF